MIDQILKQVESKIGDSLSKETGLDRAQVPDALQSISSTVMQKAKTYVDKGNIMELKEIFTGENEEKKQNLLNEVKGMIGGNLMQKFGISEEISSKLTDLSIPEIINTSKEQLLGADGKIGLDDIPRLMSFFKSEGKEVKSGLGGLFG